MKKIKKEIDSYTKNHLDELPLSEIKSLKLDIRYKGEHYIKSCYGIWFWEHHSDIMNYKREK